MQGNFILFSWTRRLLESEKEIWDNRCVLIPVSPSRTGIFWVTSGVFGQGRRGNFLYLLMLLFLTGTESLKWEKELQQKQLGLVLCSISSTGRASGCGDQSGNHGHALCFIVSKEMKFLLPSLCCCSLFCLKPAPEMEWKRSPSVGL